VEKKKVRQAENLYLCQYSPVKSCRRCRPGQQQNEVREAHDKEKEPDSQRRVQPVLGSNGKVVPCCVRGIKIRRETLLPRGQIIASRVESKRAYLAARGSKSVTRPRNRQSLARTWCLY
jgi:hypothetical protein